MSRKLYSAAQVRELDRRAIAAGTSGQVLMQRAAQACWQELLRRHKAVPRIDIVCGGGNNGGDGYEIARLAHGVGRDVRVWRLNDAPLTGDAHAAQQAWLARGGAVQTLAPNSLDQAEIVIDALFGTGLSRALEGVAHMAVIAINAARDRGAWVMAVDVPSGLDATTGKTYGVAVHADVTVTFVARKLGFYTGTGVDCAGEIVLDRLGVDLAAAADEPPLAELLHRDDVNSWLHARPRNAHKGVSGHVLLVGGDFGMSGAALLAARAALRSGAGLVSVATRAAHAAQLTAAQPELMCHGVESLHDLLPLMQRASVIAVGPGLGQGTWARMLFARLLESSATLVVDADALNLLAATPVTREQWVLTPHPGEAARLLHCEVRDIQDNRPSAATSLQQRYGGVAVLKGAGSLVQGQHLSLCPYGNSGMAVGGMGDVLTGIIAALIAQGLSLENAAQAGVLVHALAGDRAATNGERGMLPSDLLAELRAVVNP